MIEMSNDPFPIPSIELERFDWIIIFVCLSKEMEEGNCLNLLTLDLSLNTWPTARTWSRFAIYFDHDSIKMNSIKVSFESTLSDFFGRSP